MRMRLPLPSYKSSGAQSLDGQHFAGGQSASAPSLLFVGKRSPLALSSVVCSVIHVTVESSLRQNAFLQFPISGFQFSSLLAKQLQPAEQPLVRLVRADFERK